MAIWYPDLKGFDRHGLESSLRHYYLYYCEKTILSLVVYGLNTLCKENKSKSLTEKVSERRCQTTDKQKQGQFKETMTQLWSAI